MSQWGSISEFISMGGYGKFVWGAYGMVFFCFMCELYGLTRRRKKAVKELIFEARAHQSEGNL